MKKLILAVILAINLFADYHDTTMRYYGQYNYQKSTNVMERHNQRMRAYDEYNNRLQSQANHREYMKFLRQQENGRQLEKMFLENKPTDNQLEGN